MNAQRVIKKYQNRRLYDTFESVYITLSEVKELVMRGVDFVVQDAKTETDITRQVLLSIILEEEAGGVPLFTNQILRQIISFYGHTFQSAFGKYLEGNIRGFADAQQKWQEQVQGFMANQGMSKTPMEPLLKMQPPNVQKLFGAYFENGKKMFDMMQESIANNPWSNLTNNKPHSTIYSQPVKPEKTKTDTSNHKKNPKNQK